MITTRIPDMESLGLDRLPLELNRWFNDQTLLKLALDAVQAADWTGSKPVFTGGQAFQPQMLATLLCFSYAAGFFGSQDIEWAIRHNRTARYICAHVYPDWLTLRRFRRNNHDKIDECLSSLLKQAWALKLREAELEAGDVWPEPIFEAEVSESARHRIELAVILDRITLDL